MTDQFKSIIKDNIKYSEKNSIPIFVSLEDDPWTDEIDELLEELKIKSFDELLKKNHVDNMNMLRSNSIILELAKTDGYILEVACGPGFGNIPSILAINPDSKIIANDIGFVVVDGWKRLLKSKSIGKNMHFAQFDMKNIPFKNNIFEAVSSSGGFSNILNRRISFEESYRVIKKGGRLYLSDSEIDMDIFSELPYAEQEKWKKNDPEVGVSIVDMLEETGFEIIEQSDPKKSKLDPNESTIAKISAKYNLTMNLIDYNIIAIKI